MMKIGAAIAHPSVSYNDDFFRSMKESGIDAMEITRYAEDYAGLDYKAIEKFAKKYGVELWSYHLPFYPASMVNISAADPAMRKRTLDYYTDIIGRATDIGVHKFVIHSCTEFVSEDNRHEHLSRSMESLDRLAEIADGYDAVIAVENMTPGLLGRSIDEMEQLVSANSGLRVCFDTNHLLTGSHVEFIEKFADRLITLHVSDFDFKAEKHWLPGEGDIDWIELKDALDRIGYNGVWMYEVSPITPDTIVRERPLTYADLAKNARCIFDGQAPKPFGKRK